MQSYHVMLDWILPRGLETNTTPSGTQQQSHAQHWVSSCAS